MLREDFDRIFDMLVANSTAVLKSKAKEYAPSRDRLHNFKVAAELNHQTPSQACWGMATKHVVSVADMVREGSAEFSMAMWDEKLGDALNYLILLYACVMEEKAELTSAPE